MSTTVFRLDRLVRRRAVADLLDALDPGGTLAVLAVDGQVLRGGPVAGGAATYELRAGDTVVGSVVGPAGSSGAGPEESPMVSALESLCGAELERRAMADEVLALYREINLLYALVERFAGLDERDLLGTRALTEVTRLVPADRAVVVVVDGGVDERVADRAWSDTDLPPELHRPRAEHHDAGALLVAPMAVGTVERGAVVLARDAEPFTAAELKLACAVASQAAAFFERVLDAEHRRAEAEARETRLRRQIDDLRIELDHHRQAEKVKRVTDTEYFADLRRQADQLRNLVDGRGEPPD